MAPRSSDGSSAAVPQPLEAAARSTSVPSTPTPSQIQAQAQAQTQAQTQTSTQRTPRENANANANFMRYPCADADRILGILDKTPGINEESKRCIANLLDYRAETRDMRSRFPRGQSAAVLVPLFVGRSGDLYVLLSRRSDALREYAGDTALPGGKIDAQDRTIEDTARREAFEEIGLPQDKERLPLLCVMEPHLAKGVMLVTPVVVLILDHTLQPNLNTSEVTSIFAQPFASFISSTPHLSGNRTTTQTEPFHSHTDLPWNQSGTVRMHRFLTGREAEGVKPVFGLTASILIKTATIGYGRVPDFEVQPPNAPTPMLQIARALLSHENPLRIACEREGIDANMTAARLLRPPLPMMDSAARMMECRRLGAEWKKLMAGRNFDPAGMGVSAHVNPPREFDSSSWEGMPEPKDLLQRIQEVKTGLVYRLDNTSGERPDVQIESYTEPAIECQGPQDSTPTVAQLGKLLDDTREMENERIKEIKGDEKKRARARELHAKVVEKVKKRLENGELDPKELFALLPKESRTNLRWRAGEDDGCHPEQALRRKRDAKL